MVGTFGADVFVGCLRIMALYAKRATVAVSDEIAFAGNTVS
ncbi:hypothetical protein HY11_13460 [Hyphomonas pacifica]|jgi:hypothetical protein|nr:hypothetical protein HY11_13460 [Hyphomonas pacifica]|tara:strand:+ start:156 stop:278 length:123 start_codon:yes stop_codon:yes gene_type:complete